MPIPHFVLPQQHIYLQ